MTTIHAVTSTQNLVDGPHKKDPRRGRAACFNMVPTTTGAAIATTKTLPELEGKFDGIAVRVPLPVVSLADMTFLTKKKTSVEEVNEAFVRAKENSIHKNVLDVTSEPLVSSDFIKNNYSSIVDLQMTRVVDRNLVKVVAWYDNEWGYAFQLARQALEVGKMIK